MLSETKHLGCEIKRASRSDGNTSSAAHIPSASSGQALRVLAQDDSRRTHQDAQHRAAETWSEAQSPEWKSI